MKNEPGSNISHFNTKLNTELLISMPPVNNKNQDDNLFIFILKKTDFALLRKRPLKKKDRKNRRDRKVRKGLRSLHLQV